MTFHNRVALVLQRVGSDAMMSALREFAELQEVLPGAMDHFDKDFVVRSRARALGVPERDCCLRPMWRMRGERRWLRLKNNRA